MPDGLERGCSGSNGPSTTAIIEKPAVFCRGTARHPGRARTTGQCRPPARISGTDLAAEPKNSSFRRPGLDPEPSDVDFPETRNPKPEPGLLDPLIPKRNWLNYRQGPGKAAK